MIKRLVPILKSTFSAFAAGIVMYYFLKLFDRSVWVKNLPFVGRFSVANLPFESFVLDTRYTFNLLVLTAVVALVGLLVYLTASFILKSQELHSLLSIIRRRQIAAPPKEPEPIAPPAGETP